MPSLAEIPTTWPPPTPVILSDSKDEISAVRVSVLRPLTLRGLAAFIEGSGLGAAGTQQAKFAVYSHDAGANRPDTLLAESAPFFIGRDDPLRGIEPALLLSPLDIDPGFVWVALHLAPLVGQGKIQVRGLNSGGRTILQAPALYSAGLPDPFPAGGTAGAQRLGIGGVGYGLRSPALGAIVGTFIVGDGTLVGQGPAPQLLDPALLLNGKAFITATFTDLEVVTPGKAKLTLKGKQATLLSDSTVVPGKGSLVLQGKAVSVLVPIFAHTGKPALILRGQPFTLVTESTLTVGKPTLILKGKPYAGGEVALVPTIPISIDLVPSVPQEAVLVPSVPQTYDLVPTVEEFR